MNIKLLLLSVIVSVILAAPVFAAGESTNEQSQVDQLSNETTALKKQMIALRQDIKNLKKQAKQKKQASAVPK